MTTNTHHTTTVTQHIDTPLKNWISPEVIEFSISEVTQLGGGGRRGRGNRGGRGGRSDS